jgi:plastocyanin
MPVPRFIIAVPLIAAGVLIPALGADPAAPAAGAIGMTHEVFTSEVVQVRQGDTLTMVNNSRWAHTVGPGRDGHIDDAAGVPISGFHLMETNDVETTGKWNTPGTFYLTCSVHAHMTVKVIVEECGCCGGGSCK